MKIPEPAAHEDGHSPAALPSPDGAVNGISFHPPSTDLSRVDEAGTVARTTPTPDASSNGLPDLPDLPDLSDFKTPHFTLPIIDWASKSAEKMAIILSLIVFLLLVPQVLNFAHRNEEDRVVFNNLPFWNMLERWEYSLYDQRFAARGPVRPKALDKIAIVKIDQASMNIYKQWPWPRQWYGDAIIRLKKAGAKVIALDTDLSDKQNPGPNGVLSAADKTLARDLAQAKNVVLASHLEREVRERQEDAKTPNQTANAGGKAIIYHTITPLDEFDEKTPDTALVTMPIDSDGTARRFPLHYMVNDSDIGSLPALTAASYENLLDGEGSSCVDDKACLRYKQALKTGLWPDLNGVAHQVPLTDSNPMHNDAPHQWSTLLNYWGPPGSFNSYSFSDVKGFAYTNPATGKIETHYTDAELKQKFNGRIVFIGATQMDLHDIQTVPRFSQAGAESLMPGVEIMATMTAMLLDGAYIHVVSTAATLWALLILPLVASLWIAVLRNWIAAVARKAQIGWRKRNAPGSIHSAVWLGLYLTLGALPVFLFWQGAVWLFIHQNLWVIAVYPLTGAFLSAGMMLMLLFAAESAERRKAMTQFSRFVSPDVLDEILAHPEEDWPRPRRVHATVLFTDLEGFTTYSENHEPEQVIECLNAYMDRMVPLVQSYGGTIDKYIGDAIMVYFGAPVPRYDHAEQALLCAIAMQEECARFRADTSVPFYMRIGVHTGDVIVGSMGSETRLDYTVIGDTVNLAARLEGKNKEFGSWIMCSAATYEAAPQVVCVESASTQVKGKLKAVEVYVVRGLAGAEPVDTRWGKQLTEEEKRQQLMEAYHKRLAEAEAALEEAKQLPAPLLALPQAEALAGAAAVGTGELVEAGR